MSGHTPWKQITRKGGQEAIARAAVKAQALLEELELVVPKDEVGTPEVEKPTRTDIRHPVIRLGSGDYTVDLS